MKRSRNGRAQAAPGGEFGEVAGVAVDNSTSSGDPSAGDVFVVDRENLTVEGGVVDVFKPSLQALKKARKENSCSACRA